jgi:hypothetical protein
VLWIFSSKLLKNLWSQFRPIPVGGGSTVRVKIRLRAIAKSAIGILLAVTPNSIPTQKTEIFWGVQTSIIYLPPRGGIPETHQIYYLSGSITVIILIKMYAQKSLLRHRANRISISLCVRELFKIYEIEKSGAYRARWYLKG